MNFETDWMNFLQTDRFMLFVLLVYADIWQQIYYYKTVLLVYITFRAVTKHMKQQLIKSQIILHLKKLKNEKKKLILTCRFQKSKRKQFHLTLAVYSVRGRF